MLECPHCGRAVPDGSAECPHCGSTTRQDGLPAVHILDDPSNAEREKLAEIRRLQRIAGGQPTRSDSMRRTKGILCLIIIGGLIFYSYQWNRAHRARVAASASHSALSFRVLSALFGPESALGPSEKKEEFAAFKGAEVMWRGTVAYINRGKGRELYITLRNRETTRTSDVLLRFSEENRSQLHALRVGERVTYTGRITDYGPQTAFFTLTNGRIVPRRSDRASGRSPR